MGFSFDLLPLNLLSSQHTDIISVLALEFAPLKGVDMLTSLPSILILIKRHVQAYY
jgi:hypothetical protein